MSTEANYYRIGVFIVVALSLLVAGIVLLGAGMLFREKYIIETYLNESAQGLDIGSPVKVRGVKIGTIDRIGFVSEKYGGLDTTEHRYVLVEFGVSQSLFGNISSQAFGEILDREIAKGLRVRVAPQGITGTAYLEIDYLDPQRYPPLPIDWTPYYFYIPSAPGAIARLEETFDSMSKTLANLERARIEKTVNDLDDLLVALRDTVRELKVDRLSGQAEALLSEVRDTNRKVGKVIGEASGKKGAPTDIAKVMEDISAASQSMRSLTMSLEQHLAAKNGQGALDDLSLALRNIKAASESLPAAMENLKTATDSMPEAVSNLNRLMRRTYDLVSRQQEEIESILRNANQTFDNLREVTGNARRYPSYLFFGEPPARGEDMK